MIDALLRLFEEDIHCCRFYRTIISQHPDSSDVDGAEHDEIRENLSPDILLLEEGLNHSQSAAVHASNVPLSLIWGPPGLRFLLNRIRYLIASQVPVKLLWSCRYYGVSCRVLLAVSRY